LAYLQTGKSHRQAKDPAWPLPELAVAPLSTRRVPRVGAFPDLTTLIDIAIHEQQPAEVLHWYDQQHRAWDGNQDNRVAEAVANDFPDRAIAIWRRLAESYIAQTKPSTYQQAAVYLRRIKAVLEERQRGKEWQELLQSVRTQHARKKKLIEMLNQLGR
jgi:uncharacterized Zn finger protein